MSCLSRLPEVGVQAFAVDEDRALVGGVATAEQSQERGLARSARPQETDELAGANHQADVVQQCQRLAGGAVVDDAADFSGDQLDVVGARSTDQRCAVEAQREGTDIDAIAEFQLNRSDEATAVDEGAVGAAEIVQADAVAVHDEARVPARNVGMVEVIEAPACSEEPAG